MRRVPRERVPRRQSRVQRERSDNRGTIKGMEQGFPSVIGAVTFEEVVKVLVMQTDG